MSKKTRRVGRKFVELSCVSPLEIKDIPKEKPKKSHVIDPRGIMYVCHQETIDESVNECISKNDCVFDDPKTQNDSKISIIPMKSTLYQFTQGIQITDRIPIETLQLSNMMFISFYRTVYSERGHYLNLLNGFSAKIFECVVHHSNVSDDLIMNTNFVMDTVDTALYCLVFNGDKLCISKLTNVFDCFDDSDDDDFEETYMKVVTSTPNIKTCYKDFVNYVRRTEFIGYTVKRIIDHSNFNLNIKSFCL